MQFIKCFVVLVALFGRICHSRIMINTNKSDGSPKLEAAAFKILTNCYGNNKAVTLMGDFPGNFTKNLSYHRSFSLLLMNDRKRTETIIRLSEERNSTRTTRIEPKAQVVLVTAPYQLRMRTIINMYMDSPYYNATVAFLVLGWSPQNKHASCDGKSRTANVIVHFPPKLALNFKLLCCDRTKQIVIYNSNQFTNQIPKPWQVVVSGHTNRGNPFHLLKQQYQEHAEMCKNLDFDKTRNMGGSPIKVVVFLNDGPGLGFQVNESKTGKSQPARWELILFKKAWNQFKTFFNYVNATPAIVWERECTDSSYVSPNWDALEIRRWALTGMVTGKRPYAYPFRAEPQFLLTQSRGNKSQLRKIFDVIDRYSWIGMYMVYIITLIFFKFFLRQSLIVGILNVVRLTSNTGLTTVPLNLAPRIYLFCLLFFVVTMQGIFSGNLAALLTQESPVRQVNSLQDLIDLRYTIHVGEIFLVHFDHPAFEGRVEKLAIGKCIPLVQRDPLAACIIANPASVNFALSLNLHVSTTSFITEYETNILPYYWVMEQRFNEVMAHMFAADILAPFDVMVDEKRLREFESQKHDPEPRAMNLGDLTFAFIILGVGLGIGFSIFIVEIMFHRFHHRGKRTRVIVLN